MINISWTNKQNHDYKITDLSTFVSSPFHYTSYMHTEFPLA